MEVSVNGSRYKAVGSVQAGVPVLLELNGSVFRQPVPLTGHLLFFRANCSTEFLSSITGVLATAGVELQSFSASSSSSGGEKWYCMGISSLLGDIGALKSLVKDAAQLTV